MLQEYFEGAISYVYSLYSNTALKLTKLEK